MSGFDHLHEAVRYHVVNTLGWRSLRPLQDAAVEPVMSGTDSILIAPTAGGKTEAAMLPLFSRMLTENWNGLGVLYLCPLKALINNLDTRLSNYASMLGRRSELWHGDVSTSRRKQIVRNPPDVLLATPESLEVMLISRTVDEEQLLGRVRAVVFDEVHAFAGDDRGWHALAVIDRLERIVGHPIQRLGLSATVGNPEHLLNWMQLGRLDRPGVVVNPSEQYEALPPAEVELDYVGSTENAAQVISTLHKGEKRLVFCESRRQVELLTVELRRLGTEAYVSHSSVSLDERRRAETAFAEGQDCVIVATSTLELGIDVGDLDRVIQLECPKTVASFLQRMGRTGRRAGSARNCLFLATKEGMLLQAAGLLHQWGTGYVEPIEGPKAPYHVAAQQLMATILERGRVGRETWQSEIGTFAEVCGLDRNELGRIVAHMVDEGILLDDAGMLSMGPDGERLFGWRHFSDLVGVFLTDELLTVLHGQQEIGTVDRMALSKDRTGARRFNLGGRPWRVRSIDYEHDKVYVVPDDETAKTRYRSMPPDLSAALMRGVRSVLSGAEPPVQLTRRAEQALERIRDEASWVRDGHTTLRLDDGQETIGSWWTFAGTRANRELAARLVPTGMAKDFDAFRIGTPVLPAASELDQLSAPQNEHRRWFIEQVVDGFKLKFGACLPDEVVELVAEARARDTAEAECARDEPVVDFHEAELR